MIFELTMTGCSAPNCSNRSTTKRMFRFPRNLERRRIWQLKCNRPSEWRATEHARLCEDHFEESAYLKVGGIVRKSLRSDAVPTIFKWPFSSPNKSPVLQEDDQNQNTQKDSDSHNDHLYSNVKNAQEPSDTVSFNTCKPTVVKLVEREKPKEVNSENQSLKIQNSERLCASFHNAFIRVLESSSSSSSRASPKALAAPKENDFETLKMFFSNEEEPVTSQNAKRLCTRAKDFFDDGSVSSSDLQFFGDGFDSPERNISDDEMPLPFDDDQSEKETKSFVEKKKTKKKLKNVNNSKLQSSTINHHDLATSRENVSDDHAMPTTNTDGPSTETAPGAGPLPESDREKLLMVETKLRKVNQSLWRLQKKHWKLEKKHIALRRENENIKESLKFLNEDQFQKLSSKKAMKWSDETLRKACELWYACGKTGYGVLLDHGFPFPSFRTLYRHVQQITNSPTVIPELIELLQNSDPLDFSETEMQEEACA